MRDLVLGGAAARFPELMEGGYLIIKEPNGSIGSPLLMEALPESCMIFLIRDPRDVVASSMDARSEGTGQAYRAHDGHKVMVRYEDLRADTLETMKRIYAALEIPVKEAELARSVEKNSWENIPEQEKGEGKKLRKAKPGGWKEDLTARQVEIVEEITAPLLNEFYPHTATTRGAP
jgi:hypothetical protein